MEFQVFIHLVDIAENVSDNAWYDALHVCVSKKSLQATQHLTNNETVLTANQNPTESNTSVIKKEKKKSIYIAPSYSV